MKSSIFRTSFQRLTERTEVEVNGHHIGTWIPAGEKAPRVDVMPRPVRTNAIAGPQTATPRGVMDVERATPERLSKAYMARKGSGK